MTALTSTPLLVFPSIEHVVVFCFCLLHVFEVFGLNATLVKPFVNNESTTTTTTTTTQNDQIKYFIERSEKVSHQVCHYCIEHSPIFTGFQNYSSLI